MSVLVCGSFDVPHWGHIKFLTQAAKFGPVTVGLSTDDYLARSKREPVFTFGERKAWLEEAGATVTPRDSEDATKLVFRVKPAFFVCGNDWLGTTHLEDMGLTVEFVNKHNLTVVYLPRGHALSTSMIVERLREVAA